MAEKIHELEYIERGLVGYVHRARCSCGESPETGTEDGARLWHAGHVKTEAEKAEKRARAQTA